METPHSPPLWRVTGIPAASHSAACFSGLDESVGIVGINDDDVRSLRCTATTPSFQGGASPISHDTIHRECIAIASGVQCILIAPTRNPTATCG